MIRCWWHGCEPEFYAAQHGIYECVNCDRTISHDEKVGRRYCGIKQRIKEFYENIVRRIIPEKKVCCGNRYKCKSGCDQIPF
jgi:hypothetical protein